MTWADRHAPALDRMRAYASAAAAPPALLESFAGGARPVFPHEPGSDRGVALLLMFSALRQGISEERLIGFLARLRQEYGTDVFRLNRMPFDELRSRLGGFTDLAAWPLWSKVPGVLRSVCDFFYAHGPLVPWVHSVGEGEACVETLASEIFMMGRTSDFRPKPRYFLWLLTQLPGAEPRRFWSEATRLCPTPGHSRFLREFGPLKGKRGAPWKTPEEKLAYHNRFYRVLFPGRSFVAFAGLDAYLKPDPETGWACRRSLGGCAHCPLAAECPGCDL